MNHAETEAPLPGFLSFLRKRPTGTTGWKSWLTTVDHKRIGILYFWTSLFFLLIAGGEALLMRAQLAGPDKTVLGGDLFNQMVTMHATTIVFLAVMPLSAAFMNYFVPLMIGARDVAFPRLNAFSYWLYVVAAIVLNASWFLGGAPNFGWFGYANLTSTAYSPTHGAEFWILGLAVISISSTVAALNFIVTILNMRAPGMKLLKMPVFVWMSLITSVILILALPPVTIGLIYLLSDRMVGTGFYDPSMGGNVLLWQHLFWVFGHPEVYIIVLPPMGIISEILPTFSRKPLFGYPVVVFSGATIAFLGFAVWAHHMFTVGMGPVANTAFALTTSLIAIPTGAKIFNWVFTLWGGKIRFTTPMLYAVAFIGMFLWGGLTGIMNSAAASDYQQHDTYFVVSHFHYTLVGGGLFGLFAGIAYWFPKMTGRLLDDKRGKKIFWLFFWGFNATFIPMVIAGFYGMPRRIYTYSSEMGWGASNLAATFGAFAMGLSVLLFIMELLRAARHGERAPADPWDARTLEWTTTSPPPVYNFAQTPVVKERDELWAAKMEKREIATLPPDKGGIHMPGGSWMPAIASLGILFGGLGLLYSPALGFTGVGIMLLAFFAWALEGEGGEHIHPMEAGQ